MRCRNEFSLIFFLVLRMTFTRTNAEYSFSQTIEKCFLICIGVRYVLLFCLTLYVSISRLQTRTIHIPTNQLPTCGSPSVSSFSGFCSSARHLPKSSVEMTFLIRFTSNSVCQCSRYTAIENPWSIDFAVKSRTQGHTATREALLL